MKECDLFFAKTGDVDLLLKIEIALRRKFHYQELLGNEGAAPPFAILFYYTFSVSGFLRCNGLAAIWEAHVDPELYCKYLRSIRLEYCAIQVEKVFEKSREESREEAESRSEGFLWVLKDLERELGRYVRQHRYEIWSTLNDLEEIKLEWPSP